MCVCSVQAKWSLRLSVVMFCDETPSFSKNTNCVMTSRSFLSAEDIAPYKNVSRFEFSVARVDSGLAHDVAMFCLVWPQEKEVSRCFAAGR